MTSTMTTALTSTPLAAAAASTTVGDIVARFHDLAVHHGDRIAVIDAHCTVTFADLWQAGYEFVARQQPGDRTVVPVPARPIAATIIAALGVWLTGGIPMPVPATARGKQVDAAALQADSVGHWCQPWRAHLHADHGGDRHVYITGGEPPTSPRVADAIGLTAGGTALLCAPLSVAAVFDTAVRQLLYGGTVVLRPEFSPDDWLATVVETGADWALLAAGQVMGLIQQQAALAGWLEVVTRTLRRIVVPAAVPATNATLLAALTARTGATVSTWYHAPTYDGAFSQSDGSPATLTPLPGLHLRTADPAGRPTLPGVAGLIEASSSSGATAHRADQPCMPAAQWRTSGDIGTLDADGNLTLHRLDAARRYLASEPTTDSTDMAKVSVAALHQTLTAHRGIASHAVYVVPDAHGEPRAQIRAWSRTGLTPAAVAQHCTAHGTPCRPEHITVTSVGAR
ncbi:hypothetical protein AB0M46_13825 [Dactylosporangium sp. NPDC051485]|uniref:hypothetical protein n=1 Tax=Dactylosporangium sp. NPDC051485 TaxID=3154846 RepID=UPI0034379CC6